jgi:hypothetical protein
MQVVNAVETVTENPIVALQSDVTAASILWQWGVLPNDVSAAERSGYCEDQESVRRRCFVGGLDKT